ncbi:hypothetical protein Tco_0574043 [Tanacetum coccineum]
MNSNTASTSGSGSLPSNTIANPKSDLKAITTRSGVSYRGPTIPTTSYSLPKVVERETEVTKDMLSPTNNGSTKDVQPPVVQVQPQYPPKNSEPCVARLDAIDYLNGINLPRHSVSLGNLADLGASINLMPLSVWKKLSLPELTPTWQSHLLYYGPIVSTSSPTLTPFGDSDFLLEEVDSFLAIEDDPTSPEVDDSYYDPEGDILLLEAFLNDDPSLPLERITKKRTKNKAKTTKPDSEWKSCEGQSQSKAKDQKSQSQSQLNKLTVKTGAVIEEYYWMQSQPI